MANMEGRAGKSARSSRLPTLPMLPGKAAACWIYSPMLSPPNYLFINNLRADLFRHLREAYGFHYARNSYLMPNEQVNK